MKYQDPCPSGGYAAPKTAAAALEPRKGMSNIGAAVTPPGAPPPSSKGSISYPKPAVGGGK